MTAHTATEPAPLAPAVGAQVQRRVRPLRVAYADPPYLGLADKFYGHLHPEAAEYDKPETHQRLIDRLNAEYDCWAMSLQSNALQTILPMCPADVRVMAWVKGFASFKPGLKTAHFAWEPIIVRGGRPREERLHCVRDWIQESMTLKRALRGAKPARVVHWLFEVLNLQPDDEFHDLFPGSGAVTAAWEEWRTKDEPLQHGLFQGANVRGNREPTHDE
jgi:hypothetical protein